MKTFKEFKEDVRKMPDGRYGVYADKFKNKKRVMTPGGKHAKELKKVYDNEKDASWVSSVYDGSTNYDHTGASNLVGYWKFNEGSGTTVEDLSTNNNNGLLTNDSYGDDGGAAWVDENDTPTWEEIESYK